MSRYEYPIEEISSFFLFLFISNFFSEFVFLTFFFFQYLKVDDEPVVRLQLWNKLRNKLRVLMILSVNSL